MTTLKMKGHQCSLCHVNFASAFSLRRHTFCKHGNKKLLHCNICGSKFSRDDDLLRHRNTKHGKRISCPYCGLNFTRKDNMKVHIRRQHENPDQPEQKPVKKPAVKEPIRPVMKHEPVDVNANSLPSCAYESSAYSRIDCEPLPQLTEYWYEHYIPEYIPKYDYRIPEYNPKYDYQEQYQEPLNLSTNTQWTSYEYQTSSYTQSYVNDVTSSLSYAEREICQVCGYFLSNPGSYCSSLCGSGNECLCCRCNSGIGYDYSWKEESARDCVHSAMNMLVNDW